MARGEGMSFKAVIRSRNRAGMITTDRWFPDAAVAVLEREVESYRDGGFNGEIIPIKSRKERLALWNSACSWNYIIEHAGCDNILLLDDDIEQIAYYEGGEMHEPSVDLMRHFCDNMFTMARDLGTCLWGMNQRMDPACYREFDPFSFHSPVLGPLIGYIKTEGSPRADESLPLKDDYDLSLQALDRHGTILRCNKWFYRAGHINRGGQAVTRTEAEERRQNKLLLGKWGPVVHLTSGRNPRICWR